VRAKIRSLPEARDRVQAPAAFQWLEAALRRRFREDLNFRMASKALPSLGCEFL
jgi:hypothetical protein